MTKKETKQVQDMMLPVPLTDEEYADRAARLADDITRANALEAKRAAIHDRHVAANKKKLEEIAKLFGEAGQLAHDVSTKTRKASVSVNAVYDFDNNRVAYIRIDTDDVVQVRDMDSNDRQLHIDSEAGKTVLNAIDVFEKKRKDDEAGK